MRFEQHQKLITKLAKLKSSEQATENFTMSWSISLKQAMRSYMEEKRQREAVVINEGLHQKKK